MSRALLALVALLAAAPALAGDGADVAALDLNPGVLRAAPPANANPFGLPPLGKLSATRERPLFSPTRRPPPAALAAPEAPPPPPPVVEAPEPPQHPPFTLLGTLLGPGQGIAWLQDGAQTTHKMQQGQSEAGWVLSKVGPRSVVFEKDGIVETVALPKAAQANQAISDPDASPGGPQPTMPMPAPAQLPVATPVPVPVAAMPLLRPRIRSEGK